MSFRSLMNHRGVIYRASEATDESGDVVRTWTPLTAPSGLNCRPNQVWGGSLQDPGPGEVQAQRRQWLLLPAFDVRERDLLRIESGPEAGLQLIVESVDRTTTAKTLHHYEVQCRVWTESLP